MSSVDPLGGRPALGLGLQRDRQRQRRVAIVRAQARDDLARLAGRLARVLREPARLLRRPLRVALDLARERERREPDPRDGLGQRVVHVARQPRALRLGRQVALLRRQPGLGGRLAVQQPARARAGRRDDQVQGGLAEVGLERGGDLLDPGAHRDHPVVDGDEDRREQRRAGPAVQQAAEQRGGERVVEERALRARQHEDHRRQHQLGREVARMAHEHGPDAVPEAQRHERGQPGGDDRQRGQAQLRVVLAADERDQRHEQQARADRDDQLAGGLQPAAGAALAALADPALGVHWTEPAVLQARAEEDRDGDQDHRARQDQRRDDQAHARRGARGAAARGLVRRAAHVVGDVVERLRERHAELLGLQLRGDEALQLLGAVAVAQRLERRAAARPELHLAQRDQHLLADRALERLGDARERQPVAQAGADGHREDVEEVRQLALDPLLAHAARRATTQMSGKNQPMPGGEHDGARRPAAGQQQRERAAEQHQARRLVAVEALHREVARAPGEVQPAVDGLAPRGADRGHDARAHERRHPLEDPPQQRHAAAAVARSRPARAGRPGRGRAASARRPARCRPRTSPAGPASAGRHVSTFVRRRISTNAMTYSVTEKPSASSPSSVVVSSRMMPGEIALIIRIVPAPMPATR